MKNVEVWQNYIVNWGPSEADTGQSLGLVAI